MAFLEEYTLLDELGVGGYATVYKVKHNKLGYVRAIRVLNATIANGEEDKTYQKFLNECRLLLRLGNGNHSNIVHIYQPLLRANKAIVEMDYVDGLNLYDYLKKNDFFLPVSDVLALLKDIGSALAYCHEDIYKYCMSKDEDGLEDDPNDGSKVLIDEETRQRLIGKYRVIHNDIHSGNIIRRDNGSYTLLDFGLAIDGNEVVRSSRKKNGAPEFKAPEKWEDDTTLTTQSDIYSFGVVLYEYLAGRVPFVFDKQNSNATKAEYMLCEAHKKQVPESIYALRKAAFEKIHPGETYIQDYPQWLEDTIMKCLAKAPHDRYANGRELFDDVSRHLQEHPVTTAGDDALRGEVRNLTREIIFLRDRLLAPAAPDGNDNGGESVKELQMKLELSQEALKNANAEIEILKKSTGKRGMGWIKTSIALFFIILILAVIVVGMFSFMLSSEYDFFDVIVCIFDGLSWLF